MFVYNHRLRDARGVPVASLAVLADLSARFRPQRYRDALWGCSIDFRYWMIHLPAEAEAAFRKDLYDFEASKQMPYITTVERAGIKKGLRRGLRQGEAAQLLWQIEKKFGTDVAQGCRDRVETADSDDLRIWSERILTADSIAQVLN